jgi:hypothetical protein
MLQMSWGEEHPRQGESQGRQDSQHPPMPQRMGAATASVSAWRGSWDERRPLALWAAGQHADG